MEELGGVRAVAWFMLCSTTKNCSVVNVAFIIDPKNFANYEQ